MLTGRNPAQRLIVHRVPVPTVDPLEVVQSHRMVAAMPARLSRITSPRIILPRSPSAQRALS
jgi:hypothetical protein